MTIVRDGTAWYRLDEDTLLGAGSLLWQHQVRDQARMLGIMRNSQSRDAKERNSPLTQVSEVRSG